MAAIERRAKKTTPEAEAPISRDTWPAPPMTEMSSGVASGTIAVHDTIPTPPPGPNDPVDDVEIPTLRGLDLERGIAEATTDASDSPSDPIVDVSRETTSSESE